MERIIIYLDWNFQPTLKIRLHAILKRIIEKQNLKCNKYLQKIFNRLFSLKEIIVN